MGPGSGLDPPTPLCRQSKSKQMSYSIRVMGVYDLKKKKKAIKEFITPQKCPKKMISGQKSEFLSQNYKSSTATNFLQTQDEMRS